MRARSFWLIAAALLLALAAWLMSNDEKMAEDPGLDHVAFPSHLRTHEFNRSEERRRALPPPKLAPEDPRPPAQVTTDPVLRALPADARNTVVIEANAIRHSELGQLFVDCLRQGEVDPFARLQQQIGLDVLEDLDRVAVAGEAMMFSGHFADARWDQMLDGEEREPYGDQGSIVCSEYECMGVWGDELVIAAEDRDSVTAAIDRIEGRAEVDPPIEENQTYGEIYGSLDPERLAELLPADQSAIGDTLRQVVDNVGLHVDAMDDVAMVADLSGADQGRLTDLGKSLGSALAVARMAATAQGEDELAELLSHTRVSTGGGVSVELALPRELLQKHLEAVCRQVHAPSPPPSGDP